MLGGKSAHEVYLVQRVKGQIAGSSGEPLVSAEAFEAAIASGAIPTADKISLLGAVSGQYYSAKQYAKAGEAANRYFAEGGTDQSIRTLQIQALYLGGDLAKASKELQAEISTNEKNGKPPAEQQLQMLADLSNRQKDNVGFTAAMEKLVANYPKRDYWQSLVYAVATKPGLATRLQFDVLRVKLATDTLRSADEFVEGAVKLTKTYVVGNPLDQSTTMGPLAQARFADFIREQKAEAVRKGATAHVNMKVDKDVAGSPYLAPEIYTGVDHQMSLMRDESFGPVVGIMKVRGDEDAIALMNDSPYGLSASIWTQDIEHAAAIGDRIETGTVFMNRCDYLDPALVWTGVKETGKGASLSVIGIQALTRPKSYHLKVLS